MPPGILGIGSISMESKRAEDVVVEGAVLGAGPGQDGGDHQDGVRFLGEGARMETHTMGLKKGSGSSDVLGRYQNPKRTMGVIGLWFYVFNLVCASPVGIEQAVHNAGALPTLIGIGALCLCWGLPQSLVTAEMATVFQVNGGYVVWVKQILGRPWMFIASYNSVLSNILDLAVYPVLVAGYVTSAFPTVDGVRLYLVKLAVLIFVSLINIVGLTGVALTGALFTCLVLLPFFAEPFFTPIHWDQLDRSAPDINWAVFTSTIIWNFQGWDSVGAIAGEVKNPKRSYPIGVILAILLIGTTYVVPVVVGVSVEPDFSKWKDGYFVDIAQSIGSGYGYWVLAAAGLALVSEYNVSLASYARTLQSMAAFHMLPELFSWNPKPFATPIPAILAYGLTTAGLMIIDFGNLIILDTLFKNVTLFVEVVAFLYFKHNSPDVERPFAVPGGLFGAYCASLPKVLVLFFAFYSVGFTWYLAGGILCNIVLFGLAFWWASVTPDVKARVYGGDDEESKSDSAGDSPTAGILSDSDRESIDSRPLDVVVSGSHGRSSSDCPASPSHRESTELDPLVRESKNVGSPPISISLVPRHHPSSSSGSTDSKPQNSSTPPGSTSRK